MKNYKSFHFAFAAAAVMGLSLTACGDDVTEVTRVHKDGMAVLEAGEKLSKQACDTTNVGEMLFVTDSSEVFVCDGESWQTLKGEKGETGAAGKDGSDGKPGAVGKNGSDGANGTSCTVKSVKNKADLKGLEVTCGKTVVDTIWNGAAGKDGKSGNPGKAGESGTSCTAKSVENDAGLKGFELTCGETVVGTVWNGQKGGDGETGKDGVGCSLTDDGKGSVAVSCGEGDDAVTTTIYKAICGTKPYDPETQYCLKVTRNETDIYSVEDFLTDSRDNKVYKTVVIGEGENAQTWMAENLNHSVNPGTQSWCGGGSGEEEGDCSVYGRLYTWAAAVGKPEDECGYGKTCNLPSGDIRGVCPEGWHLPTKEEWQKLVEPMAYSVDYFDPVGNYSGPGKKMKAEYGWNEHSSSSAGTNAYGFSALPAGSRVENSSMDGRLYFDVGLEADFWTASEYGGSDGYYFYLRYNHDGASQMSQGKSHAISVRCIKD